MFNPDEVLGLQAYRLPGSSSGKPRIALTIDDGTSARTNDILDGWERLVRKHPDLSDDVLNWFINAREPVPGTIQRILDAGHAIGSHGYYHLKFTTLSCGEIRDMVLGVEDFVNARIREPIEIRAYRPPWGATNSSVQQCTDGMGYEWWNWTIDTRDYTYPGRTAIITSMERAKDGDIILMHDSSDKYDSVAALLAFIAEHHDDYEFVQVPGTGMYEPCETGSFKDVCVDHMFADAIEWLHASGITAGCNADGTRFCPGDEVTRSQMAAFLNRGLSLPKAAILRFDDVPGDHTFFWSVEAISAAGITVGCNPPANTLFCPERRVTRGEMAAFLTRALQLPAYTGPDRFVDDDNSVFEGAIERLAQAGITLGCNPPTNNRFCPNDFVTRGQMAAFLKRALN
jgi:peptidoglycan/xylan/chitin deacetylase (PgdA/CDA1 family)